VDFERIILWSIIGTGISSISTELIAIREFLSQFHGNEITISVVLFSWLLLTGIGSLLAKLVHRPSVLLYTLLLLVLAILPLGQVVLIRLLRDMFFLHGVSPGFYVILVYVSLISAPYCVITGFVLPYAQKVINASGYSFESGELYMTDNIGDILGGALFSFVLVYWFTPFRIVALCSLCLMGSILGILIRMKQRAWLVSSLVVFSCFLFVAVNKTIELDTLRGQFGLIERYVESPYGRIVITREGRQHTFWESGAPLYSDADVIRAEEKVHYPLCQRNRIKHVLLISGGLGETLHELSKYHPERVDYVELDPKLTSVAVDLGVIQPLDGLRIINTDGRLFLKQTNQKYDCIIVDLPDPDTFQLNRFFTSEFFSLVKGRLKKNGVFSTGMQYSTNFMSKIRKKKLSTLYQTAKLHFKHVLIIPGGEAFFLCSDGGLSSDIPQRLRELSINTSYLEGFYYGNVTKERINKINSRLQGSGEVNSDFRPGLMRIMFKEWFAKQGRSPLPFIIILGGVTVLYLLFLRRAEYILFTTGLSTMGVEMLVIFAVQILFGYVYLKIGAIVTIFLLGLLPGAAVGNRLRRMGKDILLASDVVLLLLIVIFFIWSSYLRTEIPSWSFLGYGLVFSFVSGFQFPVVASLIGEEQSPAAGCLAADLAGAAVGTLIVGTALIPLWGIPVAAGALILVKAFSSILIIYGVR